MTLSPKIEAHHQWLQAIVYIRQSMPKQVQNHQESTHRQYALAERGQQMGNKETTTENVGSTLLSRRHFR
jgi:hypothetical protein